MSAESFGRGHTVDPSWARTSLCPALFPCGLPHTVLPEASGCLPGLCDRLILHVFCQAQRAPTGVAEYYLLEHYGSADFHHGPGVCPHWGEKLPPGWRFSWPPIVQNHIAGTLLVKHQEPKLFSPLESI